MQSDLVTLYPGARGDQARSLLSTVDADMLAGLVSVWPDDSSAALTLNSNACLHELARTISNNRDSITHDSVTLAVAQGDALTLTLQATPGDLATKVQTAMALVGQDHVTRLTLKPGFAINLDLEPTVSDEVVVDYAPLLKGLSSFGERLCVDWTTGSFCVVTAQTIDPSTIRGGAPKADVYSSMLGLPQCETSALLAMRAVSGRHRRRQRPRVDSPRRTRGSSFTSRRRRAQSLVCFQGPLSTTCSSCRKDPRPRAILAWSRPAQFAGVPPRSAPM